MCGKVNRQTQHLNVISRHPIAFEMLHGLVQQFLDGRGMQGEITESMTETANETAAKVTFENFDTVDKLVYIHGVKAVEVNGVNLELSPLFEQ